MSHDLRLALLDCTRRRALEYGAIDTPEARRRYFRELAAMAALQGHPSAFSALG